LWERLRGRKLRSVPSICILTLSYSGDLQRFSLLRRSLATFAPGIPHVTIVNTEDLGRFAARFGGEPGLELLATRDVLPASIERRRRRSGRRRLTRGWLRRRTIKGWYAQQLAKIFALASCRYEAAVFVDSDVFVCQPLSSDYFYVNGSLKLFRQRAANAEQLDYDVATHDILGNPLHTVTELYDYIFSPCCFRRSSAVSLLAELDRRGLTRRDRWIRRFLRESRPSEYNLLGYAATVLEGLAGYHLVECDPGELHHSIRYPEDRARLLEEIESMRTRPKPFALVQSTLGVGFEQISEAFDRLVEAQARAPARDPSSRDSPPTGQ
jgi:Family of unknown function (DUF6492)